MTANASKLSGIIPPMITPLTAQGELDVAGLERLVTHLLDGGVAGVFVLGSSGEGPWLTAAQQCQLVRETVRLVAGRVPVLAGALEPCTARTLENMHQHHEAGADLVVITSPYYFQVGPSEQIRHIETLATEAPLPVMLYNIPPTTHNPIAPDTVRAVLPLENLVGIKDSAGDWDNFTKLLQLRAARPDFVVFQGAEKLAARSLLAGADGVVPGLGNLVPALFRQIFDRAQTGQEAEALAIQARIDQLWTLHTHDYWLVCLKYAAAVLGFGSGQTCGHTAHLTDADRQQIQELVHKIAKKPEMAHQDDNEPG
jgi:dihydrodipicolinate synthase/N-acetylneuraminate lyase